MTAIKFLYGASNRLQAVVSWLASAHQDYNPILVYTRSIEQGEQIDSLLWTQEPTGFVPHCFADDDLASETPIIISHSLENPLHDACLLNLTNEIPPHFSRFHHLIEIVSNAEEDKLPGRERYRFYRDRGYPLESKDISRKVKQ